MKFLAKHKKLSLIFSFLAAIILTLGGILLLNPVNKEVQASGTTTFYGNGGTMMKNLFSPSCYSNSYEDYWGWQWQNNYDDDSGGSYQYGASYASQYFYTPVYMAYLYFWQTDRGSWPYVILNYTAELEVGKDYALNFGLRLCKDGGNYAGFIDENYTDFPYDYACDLGMINEDSYTFAYHDINNENRRDPLYALNEGEIFATYQSGYSMYQFSTDNETITNSYATTFSALPVFFAAHNFSNHTTVYNRIGVVDLWLLELDENGQPCEYESISYTPAYNETFWNSYFQMPAPERDGYDFIGYSPAANSTDIVIQPNTSAGANYSITWDVSAVSSYSEFYAQWQPKSYSLELDFNTDDLSSEYINATYTQELPSVADKLKHRPGYIFEGFYTQPSGGTKIYDAAGESNKTYDLSYSVLYAQWEETWAVHAQQPIFENNAYQISTPEELAWIAWRSENGETFDGVNFVQTANIDLNCNELARLWCPIARTASGKTDAAFQGNYNGNGYKILDMITAPFKAEMTSENPYCANEGGLFANISEAVILNVCIAGNSQVYGRYSSGIVSSAAYSQISGCVNMANAWGAVVGGVVGMAFDSDISDCINQGIIVIDYPGSDNYAGGIVGVSTSDTFVGLTNMGEVDGYTGSYVGGIVGSLNSSTATFEKCNNFADIGNSNVYYSGGLVGFSSHTCIFEECLVEGNIESYVYAGGLVGGYTNGGSISVSCSYAKISLSTQLKAGGVIGHCIGDIFVTNSYIHVTDVGASGKYGACVGFQRGDVDVWYSKIECDSVITSIAETVSSGEISCLESAVNFVASAEKKFYKDASSSTSEIITFVILNNDIFPTPCLWIENHLPTATYDDLTAFGYEIV